MSASYVFFWSPQNPDAKKECTLEIADSTPVREVMKTVGDHMGIDVRDLRGSGSTLLPNSLWGDCNIPAGARIRVRKGPLRNTEQPPSPPVMPSPVPTRSPATTIQTDVIIPQEEMEYHRETFPGDESLLERLKEECKRKPAEFRTPESRQNWLYDNYQKGHSPKTEDTVQTAVQSPSSDDQCQQRATEEPVKTATITVLHSDYPYYEHMIRVRDALAKYPNKREILTLIHNRMDRQEKNSIHAEANRIASWYGLNPDDIRVAFPCETYMGRARPRKKAPKA